jgi:hypothetical protein
MAIVETAVLGTEPTLSDLTNAIESPLLASSSRG